MPLQRNARVKKQGLRLLRCVNVFRCFVVSRFGLRVLRDKGSRDKNDELDCSQVNVQDKARRKKRKDKTNRLRY